MAQISLTVSTEYLSRFSAHMFEDKALCIDIHTNIASGYNKPDDTPATQVFCIDDVMIHGTLADLRKFAERIAAVVPHNVCDGCDTWIETSARLCEDCAADVKRDAEEELEPAGARCPVRE